MRESKFRELLASNSDLNEFYGEFVNGAGKESEDDYKFPDGNTLKFKCLEQYGGEGCGDDYWVVFSVTDEQLNETTNYRLDGWYASYHGHEFHDYDAFYEVEPVEVMVIEWRKKS
jgi:hypothetical protein